MVITEPFTADELTLALVGVERTHFDVKGAKIIRPFHREVHEVVNLQTTVYFFTPET